MAARFAVRLAGVAALVGGGAVLGRGVVSMASARSNSIEVAGASATVSDAQPGLSSPASPAVAPSPPQSVFASNLRSWASPGAPASEPVQAQASPGTTAPLESAAYTVAEGDTLSQIADRFGTGTDALMLANGLNDPNLLTPGTRLTLPAAGMHADVLSPAAQPAAPAPPAPTAMPTRVPVVPVQVPAARPGSIEPPLTTVTATNSPAAAVRNFYTYLDQGQFDQAAALWSQRMQGAYPPAENINGRFARTQALTLNRADVVQLDADSGRATVAVRLSEVVGPPTATREYVGNWYLVRGATGWLLDEPSLHPN
ncbi:MAG: LysM peptidoglycan-binding domain-containing protein [Chloroflexota bacterium]